MLTITNNETNNEDGFNFRLELGVDFAKRKVTVSTHVWEPKLNKRPSKPRSLTPEEVKEYAEQEHVKAQLAKSVRGRKQSQEQQEQESGV